MAIVRRTAADLKRTPPRLTEAERARLLAFTDDEIEAAAADDPDNPELTEDQLARMVQGRRVRLARQRAGMTRAAFAQAFKIDRSRLDDLENGIAPLDDTLSAYVGSIEHDPEAVLRALAEAPR